MMVDRRGGSRLHAVAACVLGIALVLAFASISGAATASPASAAASGREKLPGHQGLVPPGATLVGPAPTSTSLPLTVTLKPRDPSALAAEVQAVSDRGSPEYRHFLTPAEVAERYGPTPATIAQVTASLRREGLTVGAPSATGLSLPVSGTVAQVQSAFSTPISKYRLASGKTGYDNATAPEVDVTVAPQIEGILGLDTLSPPQPSTSVPAASQAVAHPAADLAAPTLAPGQPTPTGSSCTNSIDGVMSSTGAVEAPDLAQAYALDHLYASGKYGAGATIALLEMSGAGYSSSDISTFAGCYGISLNPGQITPVPVDGGGATGAGTVEAELDIETALSLAPKANIEVYEGGSSDSLYAVFSQIVSDDTAKIVSASWTNGCEAYVGQSFQNSESTLFQAAAAEGQSVFVASGDQGAQGCNVNGEIDAGTGSNPVAQAVDPSTGTLYVANKSSNALTVDSEGSTSNPSNFATAGSVSTGTGSGPDAVALDTTAGKVFVANGANNTLTAISTSTCNQSTISGCGSPTTVTSTHLSSPTALAANGSTLYVANSNGTVAVFSATSSATRYVASLTVSASAVPTALAVDSATNGSVYVADGANGKVAYFPALTCNATTTTGCSSTPSTVSVGNDPVALAVSNGSGDLYVANAGTGGGISVVSLNNKTMVNTIATTQPSNGTGLVQSIGLSPDGSEVLAVLSGLSFPGDVMATVNTSTNSITSTVSLETGTDAMGQLVSDGSRDYVWVTDETNGGDVIQNLNLAVSDPASQPDVTSVGGTTFGHGARNLGPPPTEQAWNDALYYSEGAGGGGISTTFTMPAYQRAIGVVSGSTGTPCANAGGNCREVPDVSADADPSSGYIIFDSVNRPGWIALGGTSGAAPLWASVLAVVASADGNTAGYGLLNPALYLLAQQAPGTYVNDIASGTNDYNATAGGTYPAMSGYDMATGLGTPVASALAAGLTQVPLTVVVSGTQAYGGSPTFTATANYDGTGTAPFGVTVTTSGLSCSQVSPATAITGNLASGSYTLVPASCAGVVLGGANGSDYVLSYTSAANDFTVTGGPVAPPPPPPAPAPAHGYWLVGSDGGIFTFGSAQFYGSTGGIKLQRPVVGISPTANKAGYWLVASDGGVFAFGNAGYYGSIPGAGLAPAGSGLPHSLNAPIVGMVPSSDGGGYFMVASDGGVFAFGDARFEGSCPGMGGCSGAAVAVVPDASGNGYWLVTQSGSVYAFGDATFYGAPGNQGSPVTSAVRTADGGGYWVLLANGAVYAYGDAVGRGGPVGAVGGFNPASAIFADADSGGYWVASAAGAVFPYGDAPNDGSMAGNHLNGSIIAATGF